MTLASIIDVGTLSKVVLYSVVAGTGIAVIFGAGVSGAAGMIDALRERRTAAGAAWAVLAVICVLGALAAVVLGIVVMSEKS
jgi:hypothetical protein